MAKLFAIHRIILFSMVLLFSNEGFGQTKLEKITALLEKRVMTDMNVKVSQMDAEQMLSGNDCKHNLSNVKVFVLDATENGEEYEVSGDYTFLITNCNSHNVNGRWNYKATVKMVLDDYVVTKLELIKPI